MERVGELRGIYAGPRHMVIVALQADTVVVRQIIAEQAVNPRTAGALSRLEALG
jgi:hypothetical protein